MLDQGLVLPSLIERRAHETPDRTFIQHVEEGDLSYGALHDRALRWSRGLAELGVGRGDAVLLMLGASFDAVAAWLGVAWLGAVEVPIHTAYRGGILRHVAEDSTASVFVVDPAYLERLEEVAGELSRTPTVVLTGAGDADAFPTVDAAALLAGGPATGLEAPRPWDTSSVLYTSGTTGPSKGVIVPWAQAYATATQMVPLDDLTDADGWYSPFPLFHASGKIPVYAMAVTGGRAVLRDGFSASAFWDDVERYDCSTSFLIGTTAGILEANRPPDRPGPLRNTLMAPMPADPVDFGRRFGIRIASVFNMTELSCPIGTFWDINGRSCGRVRDGYEARVVDEHDLEVPRGTTGELVVRAAEPWLLTPGYWHLPDKTAEAWRNGWFHTGDLFVQDDDGWFHFLDRVKDAIRRGAENVSSMEVEAEVVEHPQVVECAALGVASEIAEEEVKVVVVVGDPEAFDPAELIAFLIPRMARFMVPRYVEVVETLPRTHSMKVRKEELRSLAPGVVWDRAAAGIELPR